MQTPPDWLDKVTSDWLLMVPYLLSLLAALVFAWAERLMHSFDQRKFPPMIRLWPWRLQLIVAASGVALFFMLIQLPHGFGLERAMREVVSEQFSKEREAAAGSQSRLDTVKYNEEQEYAKFNMERTIWLYLGVFCDVLVVIAVLGRIGLERRGTKPPPRIVFQY
jgi:hypothetical protein